MDIVNNIIPILFILGLIQGLVSGVLLIWLNLKTDRSTLFLGIFILAFSIGQNVLWAGVAAIVAMAVGMGITTTLFAWAAVALRSATLHLSNANKMVFNWVYAILSICGAAGIALFGAALFMSSSGWH